MHRPDSVEAEEVLPLLILFLAEKRAFADSDLQVQRGARWGGRAGHGGSSDRHGLVLRLARAAWGRIGGPLPTLEEVERVVEDAVEGVSGFCLVCLIDEASVHRAFEALAVNGLIVALLFEKRTLREDPSGEDIREEAIGAAREGCLHLEERRLFSPRSQRARHDLQRLSC